MLLLRLLFIAAVIAVAWAIRFTPFNELDVNIIDDRSGMFESIIRESLTTTKLFFARNQEKYAAIEFGRVPSYVPFVEQAVALLPVLQSALANESDWRVTLLREIPDQTQRAIAQNDMREIGALMRAIAQNVRNLSSATDFTSESKTTIVHSIHDDLDNIVNKFARTQSVFRKYPLIAVSPLFALSSLISVFDPIENALVPSLRRRSVISCKFNEILLEYRALIVQSRLSKIVVFDAIDDIYGISAKVVSVFRRPYNEYGYNQTNSGGVACDRGCKKRIGELNTLDFCVRDIDGKEYFAGIIDSFEPCVYDYIGVVRFRVEQAIKDPIELTSNSCIIESRLRTNVSCPIELRRHRNPTGFGWWTLTINEVRAEDEECDNLNQCDPYVRVLIDGREVFKTSTKTNQNVAQFEETYESKKVRKSASVDFGVWDDDSGFLGSADDLILPWSSTIEELLIDGTTHRWSSKGLITTSYWEDEYGEEIIDELTSGSCSIESRLGRHPFQVTTTTRKPALRTNGIPYNELDVKIFDDRSGMFESRIRESLNGTKNFFASDEVKYTTLVLGKVVSFMPIPYVNKAAALLPMLQGALADESDWKETLAKAIPDATQRAIAENSVLDIESAMRTISHNVRNLKEATDFTSESKTSTVHIIHDGLDLLTNKFAHEGAIFRKYPLVAIKPLLALSSFISVFDPIEYALVPALARRSIVSCKFSEILLEYRALVLRERLRLIDLFSQNEYEHDTSSMIRYIIGLPYNEYGYNKTNSGKVNCNRDCERRSFDIFKEYKDNVMDVCLKDKLNGKEYNAGVWNNMFDCVHGYMQVVRFRVEQAFKIPIELTNNSCHIESRLRRQHSPTGFGWWTVRIHTVNVRGTIDDPHDYSCDSQIPGAGVNPCDPYVKVFIDGEEVFKTSTKTNQNRPTFEEIYKSKKIRKTASIRFEVWDDDSGFLASDDDLILTWSTTIDKLLQKGWTWGLETSNVWKNEYDDD